MTTHLKTLTERSLHSFKDQLDESGVIFCYCGPISQELMEVIGNSLRTQTALSQTAPSTTKKLFSTFVEMMQNISHYSSKTQHQEIELLPEGIIVIGKNNNNHYVHSGNLITTEDGQRLQNKLLKLQEMDKAGLKTFYKEQRRKLAEATSKGAGLGFIEMARKANQIDFDIKPLTPSHAFFTLKVDFN